MQNLKIKIIIFTVLFLLIFGATPVAAHRMIIEEIGEGAVKVGYEDGRFSRRTEVVVYDDQQNEIVRGTLDEDGLFSYPAEEAYLIEADDGLGHRAELNLAQGAARELPRALTIIAVSAGFILIAGFFQYRTSSKKSKEAEH